MLKRRQAFHQPRTTLVDNNFGFTPFAGSPSRCRISAHPFTRSLHIRRLQGYALPGILRGDGRAIVIYRTPRLPDLPLYSNIGSDGGGMAQSQFFDPAQHSPAI
jgi:hypothetical protein